MSQLFTHDKGLLVALPGLPESGFNRSVMSTLAAAIAGLAIFAHFAKQSYLTQPHWAELSGKSAEGAPVLRAKY